MRCITVFLLAILVACSNIGCATILNSDTQQIAFDSEPTGAYVLIDNVRMGTTPCVIPVARKGFGKMITMEKAGYKTEIFKLENTLSGKTLLNVLWFPGAIVDGISGRGGHYKESVKIVLVRGVGVNDQTKQEDGGSEKERPPVRR